MSCFHRLPFFLALTSWSTEYGVPRQVCIVPKGGCPFAFDDSHLMGRILRPVFLLRIKLVAPSPPKLNQSEPPKHAEAKLKPSQGKTSQDELR